MSGHSPKVMWACTADVFGDVDGVRWWCIGWRRLGIHVVFPPLVLLWPLPGEAWHRQASDTPVSTGRDEDTHLLKGDSYARPVLAVALAFLTLFRFAAVPSLSTHNDEDFLVATFLLPHGSGWAVALFWSGVLLLIVVASYPSRRECTHYKYFSEILVPEIAALFVFLAADVLLDAVAIVDEDMNMKVTFDEVWRNKMGILGQLRRCWFLVNFSLLLAITIVEKIAPPPGFLRAMVFDMGWLLLLMQAMSLFLHHSMNRRENMRRWGSTHLAVIYGFALYFFTHSVALVCAVIFRRHLGGERPPNARKVVKHLMRHRPVRSTLLGAGFLLVLLSLAVFPALADWSQIAAAELEAERSFAIIAWLSHEWGHGHAIPESNYATWLRAVSQGLCAGPYATFAMTLLNLAALWAVGRCCLRPKAEAEHGSWEADLTVATGTLASLVWWSLLNPEGSSLWWQQLGRVIAAVAHVGMVVFSADVFTGHLRPDHQETWIATFWAASQVLQGLAIEHHAAMAVHGPCLSITSLLAHVGEFGLCEFGLIALLGWVTHAAEHVVQCRNKYLDGLPELAEPLNPRPSNSHGAQHQKLPTLPNSTVSRSLPQGQGPQLNHRLGL